MEEKISFVIIRHIGVLSEGKGGWRKELNVVSWNERPAKYDIRDWSPDHTKLSKGITLTEKELTNLVEVLKKME